MYLSLSLLNSHKLKALQKERALEIANTFIGNWEVWQLVGFLDKFGIGPQKCREDI